MKYAQKLTLAMAIPTAMVAGAGLSVAIGAAWLAGQVGAGGANTPIAAYLLVGRNAITLLTLVCVACCMGFTVWIRKQARLELGGDPAAARAALSALADGRLGGGVDEAPAGSMMHSIGRLTLALRRTIGAIGSAVDSVHTAAAEIAHGNVDLSTRTEQTASNLEQTASSMEQITGAARQTMDAAAQARELAASASDVAQRGGRAVADVVSTMEAINASARKIADIVGVIDGIAFQTNLLALNAAVEAARAGDQGRGFAVVAGEVRGLARRSADAAREIKALIAASVDEVDAGSRRVGQAGSTMDEIVASVRRVADIVGEIAAAAAEQGQGLGEVNAAVAQIDQMTQQNAALVEQSAAAADRLKDEAARLAQAVSVFEVEHA